MISLIAGTRQGRLPVRTSPLPCSGGIDHQGPAITSTLPSRARRAQFEFKSVLMKDDLDVESDDSGRHRRGVYVRLTGRGTSEGN